MHELPSSRAQPLSRRHGLLAALVVAVAACSTPSHQTAPASPMLPAFQPPAPAPLSLEAEPAPEPLLPAVGAGGSQARAAAPAAAAAKAPSKAGTKSSKEGPARGRMHGDEIGEGRGRTPRGYGLGVSGVGAGGSGKGEGIGLGSVGTVGHGAGTSGRGFGSGTGRLTARKTRPPRVRMGGVTVSGRTGPLSKRRSGPSRRAQGGVAAGEWDDNANYREFLSYLETRKSLSHEKIDLSQRRFLVVRDSQGKPVPSCRIAVKDASGKSAKLMTAASGRALLFPRAMGLSGMKLTARAQCQGQRVDVPFNLAANDGVVDIKLRGERRLPTYRTVDIAFVLDTTGSMAEEIRALKETITQVARVLSRSGTRIRIGLVEYRDRGDEYATRLHQMTTDIPGFTARVATLQANGGGDRPEDVNAGLRVAMHQLNWRANSVARLAFMIGDAPPKLGYQDSVSYMKSAKRAASNGIRVFTVAASGMDSLGQVIWRQIAQLTGGTNMFVLRGGAGPQSVGGGDPASSCGSTHTNYTSGNLAKLISDKVAQELAALDANPLRIAGLHKDEKAKPCNQRISANAPLRGSP